MDLNWFAKVFSVLNANQQWFVLVCGVLGALSYILHFKPKAKAKIGPPRTRPEPPTRAVTLEQHTLEIATATKTELNEIAKVLDSACESIDKLLEKFEDHNNNSIKNGTRLKSVENDVQIVRDKINELIGRRR